MGEITLKVPAEHVEDFRAALAHELGEEAGYVKKERRKYLEALDWKSEGDASDADLRGTMKMLTRDAELFLQAGFEGEGDIEINMEDDVGVVAYACETVARKIIGPQLVEALDCGPFDAEYAAKLRALINRLTWAIDQAAETNAAYFAGREKAEVA